MDDFDLKPEIGDNDYYQDDGAVDGVDGADNQYADYQEDPSIENGNGDSEANGSAAQSEVIGEEHLSSNTTGSGEHQQQNPKPGKSKDDDKRKLFVGGLSWDTKEKDLKEYFSKFGEVEGLTYKTDAMTGRPRGFAFIIFTELSSVEQVLATGEHVINGKKVDPKRAKARPGKIFVGGLTPEITNDDVKDYFAQFGTVVDMEVPIDKSTNQRKNYCFVTFDDIAISQELLKQPKQTIGGKEVDVKQAQPQQRAWEGAPGGGGGRGAPRGGRGARGGGRGGAGGWAGYGSGYGGAPGYGYDYYGGGGAWGGYEGYGGGDYYGGGGYGYEGYAAPRPRGRGGFVGKVRGGLTRGAPRHAPY